MLICISRNDAKLMRTNEKNLILFHNNVNCFIRTSLCHCYINFLFIFFFRLNLFSLFDEFLGAFIGLKIIGKLWSKWSRWWRIFYILKLLNILLFTRIVRIAVANYYVNIVISLVNFMKTMKSRNSKCKWWSIYRERRKSKRK